VSGVCGISGTGGRRRSASTRPTGSSPKLGLVEWWHTPKEDGGLADLYFGDDVFVPEWVPKAKAQLDLTRPARKKYHTQEERMEGARAKSRRSARRLGKRCKCGTQITNKAKTCKPCFLAELPAPAHGTNSRYASAEYKCRCDLCRAASSTYHRERRRRMRADYLDAQAAA
jgi:hypothetical protein